MNKHCIEGERTPLNNLIRVLKIMRITLSFLFFLHTVFISVKQLFAKLTFKLRSTSIKELCNEIEKKSNYIFVFFPITDEKIINKKSEC